MLVPKTVNGAPLTLNSLGKLVKHPRKGHATKYDFFRDEAKRELGDREVS